MAEELDGLNKYLAGVRVPGAIKAQSSYTLENMRQDEQANRINQLYRAGPRVAAGIQPSASAKIAGQAQPLAPSAAPSDTANQSNVKVSDCELVGELYQNIDDFEARLGQRSGDAS